jgi:hypothetical protein
MEVDIYEEAASSNVVRTFGRGLTIQRSTLNDEYIQAGDGLFNDGEEFRAKDLISGYGGGLYNGKQFLRIKAKHAQTHTAMIQAGVYQDGSTFFNQRSHSLAQHI